MHFRKSFWPVTHSPMLLKRDCTIFENLYDEHQDY
jgi:hypothetical protein